MQFDFLEPLLSADEAKRADQYTIRTLKISGTELMERAGLAVALEVERALPPKNDWPLVPVVVVCGPGNNGGDGFVVARRLWQNGIRALVLSFLEPEQLQGEAHVAARQFVAAATNELWTQPNLDPCLQILHSGSQLLAMLSELHPLVIVDAIFGTGLKRAPQSLFAEVIEAINEHKRTHASGVQVMCVDIPSGLPSDGQILSDTHIHADTTFAIQFRKRTHLSGPYWQLCGKVKRIDIGIQLETEPRVQGLLAINQPPKILLAHFDANQHKGHYGHVGVLFGSAGIEGASELCAYSALRSGAGLVSLLIPNTSQKAPKNIPEIMTAQVSNPVLDDELKRFSAFVVGPGVAESRLQSAQEIFAWAHAHGLPVVLDAGALPLLHTLVGKTPSTVVATPHPGEAARLMQKTVAEIQADRIASAEALLAMSEPWPVDISFILKGACPIVAHKSGIVVVEGGVSTLAVGGSGDVLAGLCGALFAQTRSGVDCALLATATHLQSGRKLLVEHARGFLAHEIADEIHKVLF